MYASFEVRVEITELSVDENCKSLELTSILQRMEETVGIKRNVHVPKSVILLL